MSESPVLASVPQTENQSQEPAAGAVVPCRRCGKPKDRYGKLCTVCYTNGLFNTRKNYQLKNDVYIICEVCDAKIKRLSLTNHRYSSRHRKKAEEKENH
jgi:hypothetical protein